MYVIFKSISRSKYPNNYNVVPLLMIIQFTCLHLIKLTKPVFLWLTIAAVFCGAPPLVAHAALSTSVAFVYGDVVTYHCMLGFVFQPGVKSSVSVCQANATWTDIGYCQG